MLNRETKKKIADYPDILTVNEFAELVNISLKTAYKVVREHQEMGIKVGREYRIHKANIMKYLCMA